MLRRLIHRFSATSQSRTAREIAEHSVRFVEERTVDDAADHNKKGNAHLSRDEFAEAAICYSHALSMQPNNAEACVGLGFALKEQALHTPAEQALRRAIGIDPTVRDAHYVLGTVLRAQGKVEDAIDALRAALELQPDLKIIYRDLCLLLFQSGQIEQAKAVVNRGLLIFPDSADLHCYLGNLYSHEGKSDDSISCYRGALSIQPAYPEAYNNLGSVFEHAGRMRDALECYRAWSSHMPDSSDAQTSLGKLLETQGQLGDALEAYQRAIAISPSCVQAHLGSATVLEKQGNVEQSLASLSRCLSLQPTDANINKKLGAALQRQGQLHAAITCFQRAVDAYPHVDGYLYLGNALLQHGLSNEAALCYAELLKLDPDHGVRHLVAALSGNNSERAPSQYVEKLFDDYADKFDSHLVKDLRYRVPQELVGVVTRLATPSAGGWDILDLGCGTGLVGAAIAPFAHQLVGVDLSANMLAKARALGIYHRLEQSDLLTMIERELASTYDLVIAADVLVYIGNLDELVKQTSRLLRPNGLFAFSVESVDALSEPQTVVQPDFKLNPTGRYAHSLAYLKRLASDCKFRIDHLTRVQGRMNEGKPVEGYIVVWSRDGR